MRLTRGWLAPSTPELLAVSALVAVFAASVVWGRRYYDWMALPMAYAPSGLLLGGAWIWAHRGDKTPRCIRCRDSGVVAKDPLESWAGPWAVILATYLLFLFLFLVVLINDSLFASIGKWIMILVFFVVYHVLLRIFRGRRRTARKARPQPDE